MMVLKKNRIFLIGIVLMLAFSGCSSKEEDKCQNEVDKINKMAEER